ncbi:hypothetical protein N7450_007553 [Penicillium hetheringtonii]|uniref:Lipase n=1 Tax=Penicillium hetheringtonii TaxID=911720 RepID=A0AAD6DHW1_9EURO|nr:hypothetical protein N7450_007553 [Penicillium hetheringtonii]
MRFISSLFLLSSLTFQYASAAAKKSCPGPKLPIVDPFYLPPDEAEIGGDWKLKELGAILRTREVTIGTFLPGTEHEVKAYQLLYRTQDLNKNPDASVTTIIIPEEPNMNRVISFHDAYDSPDPNCAPSYGLQSGAEGWGRSWNQVNLAFILPYLKKGAVLNIPDYEGTNAAFAVGPQSAYQVLDSIKAALDSTETTGITDDAKVIMFGYSGGGLATEWATEFKHDYAKKLPIVGAVIGGPPVDIRETYHAVNGKQLSQLNVWAMLGLMNAFPEINEYMRGDLKTEGYEDKKFLHALSRCSYPEDTLVPNLENTNISAFFHNGDHFLDKFKDNITEVGVMGQHISKKTRPEFPLMFFYGGNDTVIGPRAGVKALINQWKKALLPGMVSDYSNLMPFQDHATALVTGLPISWSWMTKRFEKVDGGGNNANGNDDLDFQLDGDGQIVMLPSHELR